MAVGFANNANPRGLALFIVQLVFLVLALVFFLLRCYVKVFMLKKVTLDDWLMAVAVAMYIVYSVWTEYGTYTGGTGRLIQYTTFPEASISLKAWYICLAIYPIMSGLIRCSIAAFLYKLAVKRIHCVVILVNVAVIIVLSLIYFFICVFQCIPPSLFWTAILGEGTGVCAVITITPKMSIAYSAIMAVSDLCLAALPIWMLWNVKLNRRTKSSIGILLGMGAIAAIALFVRIPLIQDLTITTEFLYQTIPVAIWSVLEPSLGIMAGSIATLKPLFKSFGFGSSSTKRYGSKTPQPGGTGGSSSGWGSKRHKLSNGLSSTADDSLIFSKNDDFGSAADIELAKPRRAAPGIEPMPVGQEADAFGPASQRRRWDEEQGVGFGNGWPLVRPIVHVETSVDVTRVHRKESGSSSEPIFPLQGTHIRENGATDEERTASPTPQIPNPLQMHTHHRSGSDRGEHGRFYD